MAEREREKLSGSSFKTRFIASDGRTAFQMGSGRRFCVTAAAITIAMKDPTDADVRSCSQLRIAYDLFICVMGAESSSYTVYVRAFPFRPREQFVARKSYKSGRVEWEGDIISAWDSHGKRAGAEVLRGRSATAEKDEC